MAVSTLFRDWPDGSFMTPGGRWGATEVWRDDRTHPGRRVRDGWSLTDTITDHQVWCRLGSDLDRHVVTVCTAESSLDGLAERAVGVYWRSDLPGPGVQVRLVVDVFDRACGLWVDGFPTLELGMFGGGPTINFRVAWLLAALGMPSLPRFDCLADCLV